MVRMVDPLVDPIIRLSHEPYYDYLSYLKHQLATHARFGRYVKEGVSTRVSPLSNTTKVQC